MGEIIWGNGIDEELEGKISVTIIATGFDSTARKQQAEQEANKTIYTLDQSISEKKVSEPTPEIEEVKLVEKKEDPIDEPIIEEPIVDSTDKRTVVFDLSSTDYESREEPNTPPQKV